MKWVVDPADGVDRAIFDGIVRRHASGQELPVRFAPGQAPATANPRCAPSAGGITPADVEGSAWGG